MCSADSLQSSKGSQRQLLLLHSLNQRRQKQRNYSTNRISDVIPTAILSALNFLVRLKMFMQSQLACQMASGLKTTRERVRDITRRFYLHAANLCDSDYHSWFG